MASTNPANFANLPKDTLHDIAAKGGHASHGGPHSSNNTTDHADRNPDGTFAKGSDLARELGAQGGHASHGSHGTEGGAEGVSTFLFFRLLSSICIVTMAGITTTIY